jgi:prefoldin subunit 1
VRAQIAAKTRESRLLQLSQQELEALPRETPVYDGVGKMYVRLPRSSHARSPAFLLFFVFPYGTSHSDSLLARFVLTSTKDVSTRQVKEAADLKAELANLDKKLNYLETTFKNSQQHMEALFRRAG